MVFKIGDRVGHKRDSEIYNPDEEPSFGEVVDLTTKGLIIVHWDNYNTNENSKPLDPSKLMLESEIKTIQTELEINFDKYQDQVRAKVDEAVLALEEAISLAEKAGTTVSNMVYKSVIQDALWGAGWSGSSFAC